MSHTLFKFFIQQKAHEAVCGKSQGSHRYYIKLPLATKIFYSLRNLINKSAPVLDDTLAHPL
ncbi:MAG: hypothetical protein PVJ60_06030, partial [Phycisphaerales bacterium]